jgi:hypothetical protein
VRRITIIGLWVLAACASAAVAASGAQAAEYGQCLSQKKGNFSESNCQTVAVNRHGQASHKGQFEWHPGPPPSCIRVAHKHGNYADSTCTTPAKKPGRGSYEAAPGPGLRSEAFPLTIAMPSLANTVECEKELTTGQITGLDTELETTILTGCHTQGEEALSCATRHQRAGTIKTLLLETRLIAHGEKGAGGEEPAPGQVWTELSGTAANNGVIAQFACGSSGQYRLSGSVSGPTSDIVNVISTVRQIAYEEGAGEQNILTEFSPTRNTWIGPYASVWDANAITDFSSELEIRTS